MAPVQVDKFGAAESATVTRVYREENGQLYRRIGLRPEEEKYMPWKLCVGSDYRNRVLEECHDHPTAGDLEVRKPYTRV